jgi:hypothetical protein
LRLPSGVLAQLALLDSNANAHMLGILLAPHGVVGIPPKIFWHLLPCFMRAVLLVVFDYYGRLVKSLQIVNGLKAELRELALRREHVGTILRRNECIPQNSLESLLTKRNNRGHATWLGRSGRCACPERLHRMR